MTLLYFAWVRERIGRDSEEVALPADVQTVAALLDWLRSRGGGYAQALEDLSVIRVAVNQEFATPDHAVADGDEIALFPPVTGGARIVIRVQREDFDIGAEIDALTERPTRYRCCRVVRRYHPRRRGQGRRRLRSPP